MKLHEISGAFVHSTARVGSQIHSIAYHYRDGQHSLYKKLHPLIVELEKGLKKVRSQAVSLLNLQPSRTEAVLNRFDGQGHSYLNLQFKPSDEALEFHKQMAEKLVRKLVETHLPDFRVSKFILHKDSAFVALAARSERSERGKMVHSAIEAAPIAHALNRAEMKWW